MKKNRYLLISLLIAAIVSLGIGQAGADVCPPVCDHCHAVSAVPLCCEEMGDSPGSQQQPVTAEDKQQSVDCEYSLACLGASQQSNVAATLATPAPELVAVIADPGRISFGRYPVLAEAIRLKAPPRRSPRSLYTLNCSFLI